ncbi:MAG: squalene/phytoene synthase family protein [Bacteroidales bacterium]|nr:squalene/phytoene synthase family protein [Bacteroidales bacterium]
MDPEINKIINSIAFENIEKHPNILIAARFWDERRYFAAKVCYRFMRMIDDHIDDRKAEDDAITCLEKQELTEKVNSWIECLDKIPDNDPIIKELTDTISTFNIPIQLFHNFAKSMLYDINHNGFSTLEEFMDYAEGASVAPASVFVHLCCLSEENNEYNSPDFDVVQVARPCAIFSYIVHIIRDFQEDQRNNLNYFAVDILKRNNLIPSDLKEIANGGPVTDSFREVIREYCYHAQSYGEKALHELQNLSTKLSSRYLLSLHMIYNLYKQVFDRIDINNGNFTSKELNPTPHEIKDKVLEVASSWQDGLR